MVAAFNNSRAEEELVYHYSFDAFGRTVSNIDDRLFIQVVLAGADVNEAFAGQGAVVGDALSAGFGGKTVLSAGVVASGAQAGVVGAGVVVSGVRTGGVGTGSVVFCAQAGAVGSALPAKTSAAAVFGCGRFAAGFGFRCLPLPPFLKHKRFIKIVQFFQYFKPSLSVLHRNMCLS